MLTPVQSRFSSAAATYESQATLQAKLAHSLLDEIPDNRYPRILDVGCGTGLMSRQLGQRFPHSKILGIDPAPGMIAHAQNQPASDLLQFECHDLTSLPDQGPFDLLVSNSALHWCPDFSAMLARLKHFLSGPAFLNLFGPDSYSELAQLMGQHFQQEIRLPAQSFLGPEALQVYLERHFPKFHITQTYFQQSFPNTKALLSHLKYTGTQGPRLALTRIWTPYALSKLDDLFLEQYGQVQCTYQVIFIRIQP